MPREEEDIKRRRKQNKPTEIINKTAAKVVGYELKRPAIADFYEGEWYGLDFQYLKDLDFLRVVWQVTCGPHGRHRNDKADYAVSAFINEAKKRDIKYGLYHLMLPGDASRQADFYIRSVDDRGGLGDMMPILDVEIDYYSGKNWASDVKIWLDIVGNHYGEKPLIYTSKYYWSFLNYPQGKPAVRLPPPWTKDYPGWFAGYPFVPYLDANVTMPKTYQANGFTDWAIWQYYPWGRSTPPRGYNKPFPVSDLNLVSPWFEEYLRTHYV